MCMTPSDIIDKLGGPSAVGAHCSVPVTTAGNWKLRQSIPARYHRSLLNMAREIEVDLSADEIADAHACASHASSHPIQAASP